MRKELVELGAGNGSTRSQLLSNLLRQDLMKSLCRMSTVDIHVLQRVIFTRSGFKVWRDRTAISVLVSNISKCQARLHTSCSPRKIQYSCTPRSQGIEKGFQ
jgi:hypothetical protein